MSVQNDDIFLSKSIENVLNQTYTNFDFIAVDDFSDDNSSGVLNHYQNIDSGICVIRTASSLGLAASLNFAIRSPSKKSIARMDSDDVCMTIRFESC